METPARSIELLIERLETYSKTTFDLSKLKLLETITNMVSSMVPKLSAIFMIALFVLVLNIGIALWLGELLGKSYYGFFIVAGFYLIAGIVMHFFMYNWTKKPITDFIIKQALQEGEL
jgi:hypothetical protein